MRHRKILLIAALFAVLFMLAGFVFAGSITGQQFTGCLSKYGTLYGVAVGDQPAYRCWRTATEISWDQFPAQGDAGLDGADGSDGVGCWDLNGDGVKNVPIEDINIDGVVDILDCQGQEPGPEGPLGERGPSGVALVEAAALSETVGPQESASTILLCSPGKQPLRGAYTIEAVPTGCVRIWRDRPYFDQLNQKGWELGYTADCSTDVTINLDVLCLESDFESHPVVRIVFASSQKYTGDLGGTAGADENCQDLATAAGLQGRYRAWLGDGNQYGPVTWDVQYGSVFELTDGTRVAESWRDLRDGSLDAPVAVDEFGATIADVNAKAWTGVYPNGQASDEFCHGWTTSIPDIAGVGRVHSSDSNWTQYHDYSICEIENHLYCFEQ